MTSDLAGADSLEKIETGTTPQVQFGGYEAVEKGGVDLTKADIIVTAGRGTGKQKNLTKIASLAEGLPGGLRTYRIGQTENKAFSQSLKHI